MKAFLKIVLSIFLMLVGMNSLAQTQEETKEDARKIKFEKAKITIGKIKIQVELAKSKLQRRYGLMFREKLLKNEGMLFEFENPEVLNFWMKNTLIPLSIGYFDSNKKLFKILDMEPASPMDNFPEVYSSEKPAKFALEMKKGWFEENKIKVGEKFLFDSRGK